MTCVEVKELLSAFIDEVLVAEEMENIKEHIEECPSCSKELQELNSILTALSSLEDVPVPAEFDKRLREALVVAGQNIKSSKVIPLYKRVPWKRISSLAAVFVVGLFSLVLYNNNLDDFNQQDFGQEKARALDGVSAISSISPEEATRGESIPDDCIDDSAAQEKGTGVKKNTEEQELEKIINNTEETPKESQDVSEKPSVDSNALLEEPIATPYSEETAIPDSYKVPENTKSGGGEYSSEELKEYLRQLDELLIDSSYEVNACVQDEEGVWLINITVTTMDSNGVEGKEDAVYCGQDGELWKKES